MGQARRFDGRHVLALDEYKNWLAVAVHQLTSPFAATYTAYTAWLKDSHGKLHQLLSEPHEPRVYGSLVHRFHETNHMRRIHFCGHGM